MVSVIVILAFVVCSGLIIWRRQSRWQTAAVAVPSGGMPEKDTALKSFAHGNTCLVAGKFVEATAAFHKALELEPKHPHVAGRLAEVERQQAASVTAPGKLTP